VGSTTPLWDRTFMTIAFLFMVGAAARTFISDEPFNAKKFTGEMLFAFIGAVVLYTFGVLQGMNTIEIIFFGGLGSLGGVRLVEWAIKIGKTVGKST